ncbi:MAG: hypothetical protein PF481_04325 [Bacteroidales bacterium]|jgi:hypothetical protein|nr:hypothetical protein [Bacteroidales bacterium]
MKLVVKYTSANGLYPGIGGVFMCIGIFATLINFGLQNYTGILISIILFAIGYIGFFASVSIMHKEEKNALIIHKNFFLKRITETYSLDTYQYVQILYSIKKPQQKTWGYIETTWKKTQSKHFDVYLISSDNNNPPVLIKTFIDKKKALVFLKDIASKLQLQPLKSVRKPTRIIL